MALESWGGLRLGLMALGYQQVIWTHLQCVDHPVSKPARWRSSSKASLSMRFPLLNDPANLYRLERATNYYYRSGRQNDRGAPLDVHHGGKLRRGLPEHQPVCDSRPRASIVRSWAMPDR